MQNKTNQNEAVLRIQRMEQDFDAVLAAKESNPAAFWEDLTVREALQRLADYQESGLWLEDYDRDAGGELPGDLKRGVLSQDGLYDLLQEINL